MCIAALRRFYQLVDDVLRRRLIRVAHAEIDDVLASGAGPLLEIADDVEHVGRQPLDTPELIVHD